MAGRPKRVFSDEQVQEIERLARLNCNTNTIATVLDIPFKTLERHFAKKLREGRSLHKLDIRENQSSLAKTSPDMAKFIGKNILGQVDKVVTATEQPTKEQTPDEQRASLAACEAYKREMARSKSA